jgi:hypothetical protein
VDVDVDDPAAADAADAVPVVVGEVGGVVEAQAR